MNLYFNNKLSMDCYNAKEAYYRGCNIRDTVFWYDHINNESGFYLNIYDVEGDDMTIDEWIADNRLKFTFDPDFQFTDLDVIAELAKYNYGEYAITLINQMG